ncbi:MAG: hypoxanthine-guanine phosphoribosyltransferase [Gammaproteobacteria bacterium]
MSADLIELQRIKTAARIVHDADAVSRALDVMAADIAECLSDSNPIVLAVMTGGLIPTVWLQQRFEFLHQLDYVHASRYVGGTTGGQVNWLAGPRLEMTGRSILIVDDILDEGLTLQAIIDHCWQSGAKEVRSAVLIKKEHDRCVPGLQADFVGLSVMDHYVFGCGMDYQEHFRHLNQVYAISADPASP